MGMSSCRACEGCAIASGERVVPSRREKKVPLNCRKLTRSQKAEAAEFGIVGTTLADFAGSRDGCYRQCGCRLVVDEIDATDAAWIANEGTELCRDHDGALQPLTTLPASTPATLHKPRHPRMYLED